MQTLVNWLYSTVKDWKTGVELYRALGYNDAIKRSLAQGHSEYRLRILERELRAIYERGTGQIEEAQEDVKPAPPVVAAAAQRTAKDDDPFKEKWQPLYTEMNSLRHRLLDEPDEAKRGVMAFRILELEQQCKRFWEMRDAYRRTGHMPIEETAPEDEKIVLPGKTEKTINNLRTYISKGKKRLAAEPENPRLVLQIEKWEKELKGLVKQISNG